MNCGRADAQAIKQGYGGSRIAVRSIFLAIVVTAALYSGMVTQAHWNTAWAAVTVFANVLRVQVTVLSLLSL